MPLPHLVIPTTTPLQVRLTGGPRVHPTSGYREWRGQFEATEPIVALAITAAGTQISWCRTAHRGNCSLETSILFEPYDDEGLRIRVSFSIHDAQTISVTLVDSMLTQPTPKLQSFNTGELVQIAAFGSEPACELHALVLARSDVASVRNGVWHARGDVAASLPEPWHHILTYGRTGTHEI